MRIYVYFFFTVWSLKVESLAEKILLRRLRAIKTKKIVCEIKTSVARVFRRIVNNSKGEEVLARRKQKSTKFETTLVFYESFNVTSRKNII